MVCQHHIHIGLGSVLILNCLYYISDIRYLVDCATSGYRMRTMNSGFLFLIRRASAR